MTSTRNDIHNTLLKLEMLSHGSTQAWNPSGGHSGEPDDKTVVLVLRYEEPPHLTYRRLYNTALDDNDRARITKAAQDELEHWTRRQDTEKQIEGVSLVDQILEDGKGFEPGIVAQRYNVDEAFVRRTRKRADVGTEDGNPTAPVLDLTTSEKIRRARELKDRGLSLRQIGLHIGVQSASTVKRYLDQAA